MSSYATGKIYKITSPHTDMIYVGSTIASLHRRMIQHKSDTKNNRNNSSSIIILEGDATIKLIEEYPCQNRRELESREQYYMDLYSDYCINQLNAEVDTLEYGKKWRQSTRGKICYNKYKERNRERLREGNRRYRKKNRERMLEKSKRHNAWIKSMGGDPRFYNNLSKIDPTLFS